MLNILTIGSAALGDKSLAELPDIDAIVTPAALAQLGTFGPHWPLDGRHYVVHPQKGPFKGKILDLEVAWPGSTGAELLSLAAASNLVSTARNTDANGMTVGRATKGTLLALKLSHRFKASPHFHKTMRDIKALRADGAVVPEGLKEWLAKREKETLAYHRHPNLQQGRSGFFRPEEVPYVYVHDDIHKAVAIWPGNPAYLSFQADGEEVKVDRAKWDRLPGSRQLDSVMEEAYVLALERHQIPNSFAPDPKRSFLIALEKICTTISSGWWREWAWEHWDAVVAHYNSSYVEWFLQARDAGFVGKVAKMGA